MVTNRADEGGFLARTERLRQGRNPFRIEESPQADRASGGPKLVYTRLLHPASASVSLRDRGAVA